MRNAGGEFDDFEAAGGLATGVGEDFAVLGGDEAGEVVEVLLEELAETEEDAGATQRRLGGPGWESGLSGGYSGVEFGAAGQRDEGLHLTGGRIEDVGLTPGCAGDGFAIDPMRNGARSVRGCGYDVWKDGGGHRRTSMLKH